MGLGFKFMCGVGILKEDWLPNLWGPVQNENMGPWLGTKSISPPMGLLFSNYGG